MVPPKDNQGTHKFIYIYIYISSSGLIGTVERKNPVNIWFGFISIDEELVE